VDLNETKRRYGTSMWKPETLMSLRGFWLGKFRDTYGQPCSIQESSSVEPSVWLGVNHRRMHLSVEQARGLAELLQAFANKHRRTP
jgi:hypothetical protein